MKICIFLKAGIHFCPVQTGLDIYYFHNIRILPYEENYRREAHIYLHVCVLFHSLHKDILFSLIISHCAYTICQISPSHFPLLSAYFAKFWPKQRTLGENCLVSAGSAHLYHFHYKYEQKYYAFSA